MLLYTAVRQYYIEARDRRHNNRVKEEDLRRLLTMDGVIQVMLLTVPRDITKRVHLRYSACQCFF